MNSELNTPTPLTREGLFRLIVDEVCRDGVIEPLEKAVLENMARFLRLDPEQVRTIAMAARERFLKGELGEARPLDPRTLYSTALAWAHADGIVDPLEDQMLAGLRKLFRISDEDHAALLQALEPSAPAASPSAASPAEPHAAPSQNDAPAAAGDPQGGDPVARPAPIPGPRVAVPAPGSTTAVLAQRLTHDSLEAWFSEHCYWYGAPQHASDSARQGWEQFLRGLLNLNEGEMYNGLDALDDVLNSLDGVRIVDVAVALAALRWSRVLLKTSFASLETGEARFWPGADLYLRLRIKMSPILITIDHFRDKSAFEEALTLDFVYLCEDLEMLVRRRHPEPLGLTGEMLAQVGKIVAKSRVTHQAVEFFETLSNQAGRQGGGIAAGLASTCRSLCHHLPQNHPLVATAHDILLRFDPANTVFPKTFKPRAGGSVAASPARAVSRLERLITETKRRDSAEQEFLAALAGADLGPVDAILTAATASYRENRMDPGVFLFRNLVGMLFPALKEYPRPVVAFFCLGNPEGHHEEMKGAWVPLLLKTIEGGRIQAIPDFPLFPSTSLMSIPLDEAGTTAFADALDAAGGAYDVALIDPGRKAARLWHQTGDLDPSGNLFRVEREYLPAERIDEASACLDQALQRFSWLSRAWLQKGLIAKQTGDLNAARRAFEKALEVQPHDPSAHTRLGVLDKNENRMETAETSLRTALKIVPTDPSAMVTLATIGLSRVASGESQALRLWDYYIGGLHALQGNGVDFQEIAAVGNSFDPALARIAQFTPVDTVFYL